MCPVRAFALWWNLATAKGAANGGYIFRKRIGKDGVSVKSNDAMVSIIED
jgi:hypothetical protein